MSFAWKSLFRLVVLAYTRTPRAYLPGAYVRRDRALDRHRPDGLSIIQVRTASMQPAAAARQRSRGSTHCSTASHRWLLVYRPLAIGGLALALGNVRKDLHGPRVGGRGTGRSKDGSIDPEAGRPKQTFPRRHVPAACGSGNAGYAGHLKSREKKRPRAQGQASQPARRLACRWRSIDSCPPLPSYCLSLLTPQSTPSIYPGSRLGQGIATRP